MPEYRSTLFQEDPEWVCEDYEADPRYFRGELGQGHDKQFVLEELAAGKTLHLIADGLPTRPEWLLETAMGWRDEIDYAALNRAQIENTQKALTRMLLRRDEEHANPILDDYVVGCRSFGYPGLAPPQSPPTEMKYLEDLARFSVREILGHLGGVEIDYAGALSTTLAQTIAILRKHFKVLDCDAGAAVATTLGLSAGLSARIVANSHLLGRTQYDEWRSRLGRRISWSPHRIAWPLPSEIVAAVLGDGNWEAAVLAATSSSSTAPFPPPTALSDTSAAVDEYILACWKKGIRPVNENYEFWRISEISFGRLRPSVFEVIEEDIPDLALSALCPFDKDGRCDLGKIENNETDSLDGSL